MDLVEVAHLNYTIRSDGKFGSTDLLKTPPHSIEKEAYGPLPSWTKLQNPNTKVTLKLPWNTHFLKRGYLSQDTQGFNFTTIENSHISHISLTLSLSHKSRK